MAGEEPSATGRLTELLDRWESLCRQDGSASIEQFVRRHCDQDSPETVHTFRRRAEALRSVDRRLRTTETSAGGDSASTVRRGKLAPGLEPVPGYRLVERLGSGGFGEVWKATGPGGVPLAMKFVRLAHRASSAELQALETMKEVRHPHLLSVFAFWQLSQVLVIAMELADGTLWDRFRAAVRQGHAGIPGGELLEYMVEAAKGLDHLNGVGDGREGQGIQHQDIKPQNLLLCGNSVKVADFGLAQRLEHSLTTHDGRGMTYAFAAPEFLDGKTSSRSDQYALGVTYCQLRGGRLPFSEGSPAQLITAHLTKPPDLSMLPEAERAAVARALAKSPTDRWPSCRSFIKALTDAGASTVRPDPPTGTPTRTPTRPSPTMPPSIGDTIAAGANGSTVPDVLSPVAGSPPPLPPGGRAATPGRLRRAKVGLMAAMVVVVAVVAVVVIGPWFTPGDEHGDGTHAGVVDGAAIAASIERGEDVRQAMAQAVGEFPLQFVEVTAGEVKPTRDGRIAASIHCRVDREAYDRYTAALKEAVKPITTRSGSDAFGAIIEDAEIYYRSTSVRESTRELLYSLPADKTLLLFGRSAFDGRWESDSSADSGGQQMIFDWHLVDREFGEAFAERWKAALDLRVRCSLVGDGGEVLAVQQLQSLFRINLWRVAIPGQPGMYQHGGSWKFEDSDSVTSCGDRFVVLLPMLIAPKTAESSNVHFVPEFEIPLEFQVAKERVADIRELRLEFLR